MTSATPADIAEACRSARSVAVLTGAGMSAESGIPTFRDARTGLWERFDPTQLATPDAWLRDPSLVWAWYQWRAALVRRAAPHAGHLALARWQSGSGSDAVTVVTQNVDDLHERAGTVVAAHVHGSLFAPRCSLCEQPFDGVPELPEEPVSSLRPPRCDACGGAVRPGVVWFGEGLPPEAWEVAEHAASTADVVLVVGTSGVVYPFAALPEMARDVGAVVVEINPEQTSLSAVAHHSWRTTASAGLSALVQTLAVGADE